MTRLFRLCWLLLIAASAYGQQSEFASLAGRVLDDSTSTPLSNVNIYIANTTLGGNTDERGTFEIRNIPLGTHDIIASRIGYSLLTVRVSLQEARTRRLEFRLKPMNVEMGEVVVSAPDPAAWREELWRFTDYFLGITENSKECRITNPEVLDFTSSGHDALEATARKPVEIDNLALGYHLTFFLKSFSIKGDIIAYEGLPKFSELIPKDSIQRKVWKENRMSAFDGSLRHFLISLYHSRIAKDGYALFHLDFLPLDQSVTSRKLVTEDEILADGPLPGQKTLRFSGYLEVEHQGDMERGYNLLRKAGTTGQVSWLALNYYAVGFNERGLINEAFPTRAYGYWAWRRVADMLPLDFVPQKGD